MTNPKDANAGRPKKDADLSSDLGSFEDDEFLVEDETTGTDAAEPGATGTAAADPADPADPAVDEPVADADAAGDPDDDIEVATIDDDDDVPYELREERQDPATEPRTGLVSEFRDLTGRQAAWLVSNRETTTTSRSPLFYATALIVGLGVLAALVIGLGNAGRTGGGADSTIAVVGIGEQAPLFEQQLGMGVVDAESVEAAQEMVRSGEVDAALIPDVTGQGNDTIVALNSEPTAVLDTFAPQMPVTYLEPPAVNTEVATALGWGMAFLLIASVLTLGAALYANMRVEKRNRIAEILAATIPAKSAAWGRVYGLTLLSLGYLVIAVGVLLLGLSIASRTSLAVSMLPGLGWFAGLFILAHLLFLSLFLWAATGAKPRGRRIGLGLVVLLLLGGAIAPLFFLADFAVLRWLSWIPFTAPVATPLRYFASQAEWWEGLIALGSVLVAGLIAFALASAAYSRNLLRGSGRAGATPKSSKAAKSAAAADTDEDADADEKDAKSAKSAGSAKSAAKASAKTASGAKSATAGKKAAAKSGAATAKSGESATAKKSAATKSTSGGSSSAASRRKKPGAR